MVYFGLAGDHSNKSAIARFWLVALLWIQPSVHRVRLWHFLKSKGLMDTIRQEWFSNIRNDVLAGLVVALALIPEAIAFSIIAGVDPKVGLYASFSIAVIIAFTGGRPGMISAATGAMALLMVTLVNSGSCAIKIKIANALTNPVTTERDTKRINSPRRTHPAAICRTPVRTAAANKHSRP